MIASIARSSIAAAARLAMKVVSLRFCWRSSTMQKYFKIADTMNAFQCFVGKRLVCFNQIYKECPLLIDSDAKSEAVGA